MNDDQKIRDLLEAVGLCRPEFFLLPERLGKGHVLSDAEFERRFCEALANRPAKYLSEE